MAGRVKNYQMLIHTSLKRDEHRLVRGLVDQLTREIGQEVVHVLRSGVANANPDESSKKGYLPEKWVIQQVEAAGKQVEAASRQVEEWLFTNSDLMVLTVLHPRCEH